MAQKTSRWNKKRVGGTKSESTRNFQRVGALPPCRNPHQHPLLYLKGVKHSELLAVLNFMYMGEVNVAQEELNSFLSVAEELKVKGLTQGNSGPKSSNENTQKPICTQNSILIIHRGLPLLLLLIGCLLRRFHTQMPVCYENGCRT